MDPKVEPFELADEFGPKRVIHVHEPGIGLRGVLVVDNVATGPSVGGLRMAPDVSLVECARLARAMTLKNASAGLAHGGGKSVLVGDPHMPADQKEQLVRGMACALGDCQDYIFGPDMGTDEQCMAWVKDEIGRAVGLPRELGGIPLDELGATGFGVRHSAAAACEETGIELAGARFVIQGFGAVGQHAARQLELAGARLVAVSDSGGALCDPAGLDVEALASHKHAGRSVAEYEKGTRISGEDLIGIECEIWVPAARPDVLNEGNVDGLQARLVISGANIPATPGAEQRMHERGIVSVPDFIANAGGVICAAMEYQGATQSAAFDAIEERVRDNTHAVLRAARQQGVLPRRAAEDLAMQRVRSAMANRRWSIF